MHVREVKVVVRSYLRRRHLCIDHSLRNVVDADALTLDPECAAEGVTVEMISFITFPLAGSGKNVFVALFLSSINESRTIYPSPSAICLTKHYDARAIRYAS